MNITDIIGTILIGPLKLLFEIIFSIAYSVIQHPGPAIIILSLAMNILLLPLYKRADDIQLEARDTENKLGPVVAHIKKTFSGDERMMILQTYYRQNHYSPLSVLNGSVSLMLEIPFFMAAYQFLSGVAAFQNTSFGPIADLSKPDGLLLLGNTAVNLLPIVMTLVNVISCALYLKDFPLKTKIQLYGMALFFLVFLYSSPSALVLYWTLNNLFSLVKNLFSRIKNSKSVLRTLLAIAGIGAIGVGILMDGLVRSAFMICLGCGCQLPWLLPLVLKKFPGLQFRQETVQPNRALFLSGALFLTVLIGLLIPSTYISVSPQEYIDIYNFYNPIWYVVHTFCLAAGTFLIWAGIFYWLANPWFKMFLSRLMWVASGIMIANYMFFGTDLGVLSATLTYTTGLSFHFEEKLLNAVVCLVLLVLLGILSQKSSRKLPPVLLAGAIAMGCMSMINTSQILTSTEQVRSRMDEITISDTYSLSTTGENVIVFFLDRAIGPFVPYLMEEDPELLNQFDGFTYYSNTLSYGGATNFTTPSIYGGYEYTPLSLNLRDNERMVDKHNEALKVLPSVFSEHGYDVTMFGSPIAGYQWIPDLSIFNDIENVSAYQEVGRTIPGDYVDQTIETRNHNFFLFSIMKTMPILLQSRIYQEGNYWALAGSNENVLDGMTSDALSTYNSFCTMLDLSEVIHEQKNTFVYIGSHITHAPAILQEPDFTFSAHVDNSAYYPSEGKTITSGGTSRLLASEIAISNYHINMAAFRRLGNWFDYLRENGVYDNSKIIIVSDHGYGIDVFYDNSNPQENPEYYLPLLMVKDFGATGFHVSDTFMTNADVPALAVAHLGENIINPYTGNLINADAKNTQVQHVILSSLWDVSQDRTQFLPSQWATVSGDVTLKENWIYHDGLSVMPPDWEQ